MWKWIAGILVVITSALGFSYLSADKDVRKLLVNLPTDRDVLFWTTHPLAVNGFTRGVKPT